jgi:pheromone shutdown protein TraB
MQPEELVQQYIRPVDSVAVELDVKSRKPSIKSGYKLYDHFDLNELATLGRMSSWAKDFAKERKQTRLLRIIKDVEKSHDLAEAFIVYPLVQILETNPVLLDERIQSVAMENKKNLAFLETAKEQYRALLSIEPEDMADALRLAMNWGYIKKVNDDVIEPYLSGSLDTEKTIPKYFSNFATKTLVTDRDNNLYSRSKPLLDKGRTLIAVGAGHCPGIIKSSEKDGFSVKRKEYI